MTLYTFSNKGGTDVPASQLDANFAQLLASINANLASITGHVDNTSNPHSVTVDQIGAQPVNSTLTVLSGLTPAASSLPYFDASTNPVTTSLTALAISLLGYGADMQWLGVLGASGFVATIAAMTAKTVANLTDGQTLVVTDAQRGGIFKWVAASTATADSVVIFNPDAGGTGRFIRQYQGAVRTQWAAIDLTGVTSASTALNAIMANYRNIIVSSGTYLLTACIKVTGQDDMTIIFEDNAEFVTATLMTMFAAFGTLSTDLTNTLASNTAVGDNTYNVTAGKGASFATGDLIVSQSEALMPAPYTAQATKRAEMFKVESVATDAVSINGATLFAYNTADTALIRKVTPLKRLRIENMRLRCLNTDVARRNMTIFAWCEDLNIVNIYGRDSIGPFVQIRGCFDTRISNPRGTNLLSNDVTAFGYLINEQGLSVGTQISGGCARSCRHFYTTTSWTSSSDVPEVPQYDYGVPYNTLVDGWYGVDMRASGIDCHQWGINQTFSNGKLYGGEGHGMQLRAYGTKAFGNTIMNVKGCGVYIDSSAGAAEVKDNTFQNTNNGSVGVPTPQDMTDRGCIFDNGPNSTIENNIVRGCGGPAYEGFDAARNIKLSGNRVENVCLKTSGQKDTFRIKPNAQTQVLFNGNHFLQSSGLADYGVTWNSSAIIEGVGNYISGANTSNYNGAAHHIKGSALRSDSAGAPRVATTIASGILDIASSQYNIISVAPEGGVADSLDYISGGAIGDKIVLIRSGSQTITVTHNAGTPNGILLNAKANASMTAYARIELTRADANYWVQTGYT